jgi:hypothetical protein
MTYEVVYTEIAKVKRRVWVTVEADSEEEAIALTKEGDAEFMDADDCYDIESELVEIEDVSIYNE